ncbi:MAG: hypothetical protein K2H41_07575 [Acetatifactor sp.]|nr:hypothetical protein [Acetatifactor sp.]
MILSVSLFSCKVDREVYISKLKANGINMLHIDYIEGGSVSEEELYSLYDIRSLMLLDIHMIADEIKMEHISFFNEIQANYLCYQYENLKEKNIDMLEHFEGKKGLAFTMETPLEEILRVADALDFVLIMCTIPGISGQKFNSGNIERIRELRRLMPNIKIHVDGGIDVRRMEIIKHYNLELIVVGSFFADVEGSELTERICQLRYSENDTTVEEVMIPIHCLTTIDEKDSFETVLDALETDKLSIVTVVQDDCLLGIISDGDMRRLVKKYHGNCFNLKAGDIMNSSPQILSYDTKVNLVLYHKMFLERGVLAIPCVKDDKLIGILDCTSL